MNHHFIDTNIRRSTSQAFSFSQSTSPSQVSFSNLPITLSFASDLLQDILKENDVFVVSSPSIGKRFQKCDFSESLIARATEHEQYQKKLDREAKETKEPRHGLHSEIIMCVLYLCYLVQRMSNGHA